MKLRAAQMCLASILLLASCGPEPMPAVPPAPDPPPAAASPAAPTPAAAPAAPAAAAAPAEQPRPAVEVAAMDPPPAPEKMPAVKITAPRASEVIGADKAANFEVKLDVKDWSTKEGGPHVHLILDNQPYLAVYDTKKPIKLSEVAPGAPLAEGQHVLVAFPSREGHVSVKPEKGKAPYAAVSFWIGKQGTPAWKPTDPTLVYSRPKGEYTGAEADAVILDFYLLNAELGQGKHTAHATITPPKGEPRGITITQWQPFRIQHLPDGDSRVKLELRDAKGVVVPGPWNSTERTITVRRGAK